MSFLDQLRDSVDARISEITQEITALEAALVALRDDAPPAADPPRRRGRPKGSRNRAAAPIAVAVSPPPATPVAALPTPVAAAVSSPAPAPAPAPAARRRAAATPAESKVVKAAESKVVKAAEPKVAKPAEAKAAVAKVDTPAEPKSANPAKLAKPKAVTPAETNGAHLAPAPEPARKAKAAGSGRSVEVLVAERLAEMLGQSTEGLSAISISKQAGAGYNQVLALLRQLEESGEVRRTGTRRTSLWRRVTDEERIAERAQELAGLASAG